MSREFWIQRSLVTSNGAVVNSYDVHSEITTKMLSDEYHHGDELIHTIEYSAYEKSQAQLARALENLANIAEGSGYATEDEIPWEVAYARASLKDIKAMGVGNEKA
jgi:hypothetical protein